MNRFKKPSNKLKKKIIGIRNRAQIASEFAATDTRLSSHS